MTADFFLHRLSRVTFLVLGLFLLSGQTDPLYAMNFKKFFLGEAKVIHKKEAFFEYDLLTFDKKFKKKYPLVVVFHGSGENPSNVFEKWRGEAEKHHFMVLVPNWIDAYNFQMKEGKEIYRLLNEIQKRYSVDPKRIFISGISAGGGPVYKLIQESPEKWRGAVWMSYVPPPEWFAAAAKGKVPPILFTYGRKDPHDRYAELILGADSLKKKGLSVHLLIDPDAGHEHREEWNPAILNWMEVQTKK